MGQVECLKKLKKDEWQSAKMIAEKLNQQQDIISVSLNKLFNQGLLLRIQKKIETHRTYFWRLK